MAHQSLSSEVIHAYYIDKLSQVAIAKQYGLSGSHEIYRHFGEYHHSERCSKCDSALTSKYANRTHSTDSVKEIGYGRYQTHEAIPLNKRIVMTEEKYKVFLPQCDNCGHYPDSACDCQDCSLIREINRQKLVAHYRDKLVTENPPIDLASLDARQLLLIAYYYTTHQGTTNQEVSTSVQLVQADIFDLSIDTITETLKRAGLLFVTPDCIEACIEMTSPTHHTFHESRLTYHLAGSDDPRWIRDVQAQTRSLFRNPQMCDEVLRLWGELACREAMFHYARLSFQHNIPFNKSPNVLSNVKRGVTELGLFKTITAITLSIRHGANRRKEEHISTKHAENYAQWRFDWWLGGNRDLLPNGRHDEKFPEPQVVSVFIEYFLPYNIDYGLTALREFSNNSVSEEETA